MTNLNTAIALIIAILAGLFLPSSAEAKKPTYEPYVTPTYHVNHNLVDVKEEAKRYGWGTDGHRQTRGYDSYTIKGELIVCDDWPGTGDKHGNSFRWQRWMQEQIDVMLELDGYPELMSNREPMGYDISISATARMSCTDPPDFSGIYVSAGADGKTGYAVPNRVRRKNADRAVAYPLPTDLPGVMANTTTPVVPTQPLSQVEPTVPALTSREIKQCTSALQMEAELLAGSRRSMPRRKLAMLKHPGCEALRDE